jgi:hypothetical protein
MSETPTHCYTVPDWISAAGLEQSFREAVEAALGQHLRALGSKAEIGEKLLLARQALLSFAEEVDMRPPRTPAEADLMIALWAVEGDRLDPCASCDGNCGDICTPTSAESAIAGFQAYKEMRWPEEVRRDA